MNVLNQEKIMWLMQSQIAEYRVSGDYTDMPFHLGNGEHSNAIDVLSVLFDEIPDNQKYKIVIDIYTGIEFPVNSMNKYLKRIKSFVPPGVLEPIKNNIDQNGNITVYRGCTVVKNPALCPSWTLSKGKAEWFATRFLVVPDASETVLYKGVINANDIIAYTDEREEQEIIQYQSVKHIEIVERYTKKEGTS